MEHKNWLGYCCLYDPRGPGTLFQGQKNLSVHVLTAIEKTYGDYLEHLTPVKADAKTDIASLLKIACEIETVRATSREDPRGVVVVDMVLSLAHLPAKRHSDLIILIGHDSYSLRAWREWKKTRFGLSWARRGLAWWAWHRMERKLSRICYHRIYVSPVDRSAAGPRGTSSVMPIPLRPQLHAAQASRSMMKNRKPPRKFLVPVPVINAAQNLAEEKILQKILAELPNGATATVWGAAAEHHAKRFGADPRLRFIDWVDDYSAFLGGFDLLIYPRLVGSGFHTKLAEALALGVPCMAVEWICEALADANYTGLTAFREQTFSATLTKVIQTGAELPKGLPDKANPGVAMLPLIEAVNAARSHIKGLGEERAKCP